MQSPVARFQLLPSPTCRPVRLEDDPEAPLVAHLQKHVRVPKRPSRAALSGTLSYLCISACSSDVGDAPLTHRPTEAGLQLTHFCTLPARVISCSILCLTVADLRSSRYSFVKALLEIGGRPEKIYSLVRSENGAELVMSLVRR